MANEGMLRGNRERSNSGIREDDLRNNRRDNLTQFYDDLGFSATEEQYKGYMEDEANYQEQIAKQQGVVDTAQSEYDTYKAEYDANVATLSEAQSSLPTLDAAVNESWNDYKSNFVAVNVITADGITTDSNLAKYGGTVEKTYYLPKESAESITNQSGFGSSWTDNGSLNVWMRGAVGSSSHTADDDSYNDSKKTSNNSYLHTALSKGVSSVESAYKDQAAIELASSIEKANATYNESAANLSADAGALSNYYNELTTAQSTVDTNIAQREAAWQELSDNYTERAEKMQSIFEDFHVNEAI